MHPLDNPIWQALSTTHAGFAQTCNSARKFPREVSVLAGFSEPTPENYASLASLLNPGETIGLFLQAPPDPPPAWTIVSTGPLVQMLYDHSSSRGADGKEFRSGKVRSDQPEFIPLTHADVPEMLTLTQLTKPGPFGERTHEMGDYFGIRSAGTLAAMAGERLRLPGYTEISAVCTHPDHLGRGYASTLMEMLMERICGRGELPFLHVRSDNLRAIQVYERLGFRKRTSLHYAVLRHQRK
jgi:ribosomal protein S18 acetylase RimI-like enzyme